MKKIDFHVHMFGDKIATKVMAKLEKTANIKPFTDGTKADLSKKLAGWGVDYGVVLNIATKPEVQGLLNNWAKEVEGENIICFGTVHPFAKDALDELKRIKEMGLRGVKLHPDYQEFMVDDKKVYPVYEAILELNLPLVFHTGFDPLSPDLVHSTPKGIAEVSKDFPDLTIIAAHMGGHQRYDESEEYLIGKSNVFIDTAMSYGNCDFVQFERMIKTHGADRVLFGSDCPWSSCENEIKMIEQLDISDADKEKIFYKNAEKLLNIK